MSTAARDKAFVLYEGVRTSRIAAAASRSPRRSACRRRPYQALRRGGITGKGACGAIRAGEQVLGELLGDPDPTGVVTPALRAAITWFQDAWLARLRGGDTPTSSATTSSARTATSWGLRARRFVRTSPPTLRRSPPKRYVGSHRPARRSRPSRAT